MNARAIAIPAGGYYPDIEEFDRQLQIAVKKLITFLLLSFMCICLVCDIAEQNCREEIDYLQSDDGEYITSDSGERLETGRHKCCFGKKLMRNPDTRKILINPDTFSPLASPDLSYGCGKYSSGSYGM